MCAKKTPKAHQSPETQYFIQYRQLLTGQVLAARYWLKRHQLPPSPN